MITHGYNLSNKINIELNIHILQIHHLKNDDEETIIPPNVIPIKNMNKIVEIKKSLFGKAIVLKARTNHVYWDKCVK